jgi:TP901-1 family phage major tail protein
MSAQKGKDLLLKVDDGTGTFVTVAGLRTRRLTLNAQIVDTTNSDSVGRWRELLAGAGAKRASLSGGGVFKDAQSDQMMQQLFFNDTIRNWQIIVPTFGTIAGPFQINSLDYRGEHGTEITFELALESAGALTFG